MYSVADPTRLDQGGHQLYAPHSVGAGMARAIAD